MRKSARIVPGLELQEPRRASVRVFVVVGLQGAEQAAAGLPAPDLEPHQPDDRQQVRAEATRDGLREGNAELQLPRRRHAGLAAEVLRGQEGGRSSERGLLRLDSSAGEYRVQRLQVGVELPERLPRRCGEAAMWQVGR